MFCPVILSNSQYEHICECMFLVALLEFAHIVCSETSIPSKFLLKMVIYYNVHLYSRVRVFEPISSFIFTFI
jgi:hypothetical protein